MHYDEAINLMLTDASCGFKNILASSDEYKSKIKAEIAKAKCSIATARVFIGFVETKFEKGQTFESIKLSVTMNEAAMFIGNGMGLNPTDYSADLRVHDSLELKAVASFRG